MQSGDKRGQDGQDGQDRNHIWKGKDAGGWGDITAGRGCEPGSCPGMEVEVSLFLGTHEYNGDIYNDIYYKSLKVLS